MVTDAKLADAGSLTELHPELNSPQASEAASIPNNWGDVVMIGALVLVCFVLLLLMSMIEPVNTPSNVPQIEEANRQAGLPASVVILQRMSSKDEVWLLDLGPILPATPHHGRLIAPGW
jgi:hypothetical protein